MGSLTAQEVIELLGLKPHPEGGHYRETFRDPMPDDGRGASTAILYLLSAREVSAWHRVRDASELWHYHSGAPLLLRICEDGSTVATFRLGVDLGAGERPQAIVPRNWWQAAEIGGRLDAGRLHSRAGFRFRRLRACACRLDAGFVRR